MFPLRDTVRSYTFPVVNWLFIVANAIVFLFEISLSPQALNRFILTFALVPVRLHIFQPAALLQDPRPLVTLFTHMFLHGGWFHILSNMWVLYIFGDNIEDRMGSVRYFLFYILSGLVAALSQVLIAPNSTQPALGASGAIAGVLGAYLLLYPRSRVITLILLFFIPWFVEIPAIFFLGIWFITQLFSGISSLGVQTASMGGVAWWAHIGGFIFGMLFYRLFTPRRHPAYSRQFPDEYWPW
jgi:membrane associated rhomboid family serine protease